MQHLFKKRVEQYVSICLQLFSHSLLGYFSRKWSQEVRFFAKNTRVDHLLGQNLLWTLLNYFLHEVMDAFKRTDSETFLESLSRVVREDRSLWKNHLFCFYFNVVYHLFLHFLIFEDRPGDFVLDHVDHHWVHQVVYIGLVLNSLPEKPIWNMGYLVSPE